MSFVVYILRTSKNTLYTGQTNNLGKRLIEHKKKKKGAKYLRAFDDFSLVYQEKFDTRAAALKREIEIKRLTKIQKEQLINQ